MRLSDLFSKPPEGSRLGEDARQFYKDKQPMQANVPYLAHAQENMILCKDGSLLALFKYEGPDTESSSRDDLDQFASTLDQSMNLLNGRVQIWVHQHHNKVEHYPGGEYKNPVSEKINALYRENFSAGKHFVNRNYLALLYTSNSGIDKFFDKVAFYSTHGQMPIWKSLLQSAKDSLFHRSAFVFDQRQLDDSIIKFSEILSNFTGSLPMLRLKPLLLGDGATYLHELINPASPTFQVKLPRGGQLLDGYLPDNRLHIGRDVLLFENGFKKRYVSAVSVKTNPKYTEPQIIEMLAHVDGDVLISHMVRVMDHPEARKHLDDAATHHKNVATPLFKKIVALILKREITDVESPLLQEAQAAYESIASERKRWCDHNLTVLCYGDDIPSCNSVSQQVVNALNNAGFIAVREATATKSSWQGMLPGNWHRQLRKQILAVSNVNDLIPITSAHQGDKVNAWLSEQSGKTQEAHTVFKTKEMVPYYFNYHHGSLGNMITLGPPGTGKTVLESLLTALYQKYEPITFIFDKDYSCRIPVTIQGGGYVDIQNGGARFNPFHLLGDSKHWPWLSNWLESLLISRGEPYTNEDQKRVWSAINTIARMPEQWHLSGIRTQLPPHLAERLNMWVGNGQYGAIFDNAVETFTMSDMTGLEMGYLMQNHAIAAGLLMDYVFYLLDLKFDGSRPGLVNIQEFWFMLQNEKFAQRLDNWSRTMRKRNVVVMLSTQSLQEMNDSPYQMSFIDNFPNKVFLPNQQAWAHERIYKSMFGLTDHQIGQIVNSIPQRNYYLVTPTLSRMLEISMPKELLAYLRGDGKAQNVFMRHQNSGKEGWRDDYIAEMLRS